MNTQVTDVYSLLINMFDEYNKGVGLGFRSFREKLSITINDKGQEDLKKQKKMF